MKDIPSRTSTKPSTAAGATALRSPQPELLPALVLGANLWVVGMLWPLLCGGGLRGLELALALLCPLPLLLAAGVQRGPAWLRPALLLCAYPALLGAATAARPEVLNQQVYGPLALGVLWLSLCAYGASAAMAAAVRGPELQTSHAPLGRDPWDTAPPEPQALRRAFIALCFVGSAALCLIAPTLGGLPALTESWGEAALGGGVLTAVVGAALGIATLALYLGDGLRGGRAPESSADGGQRAAWFLFLTLLGVVTYFVTQP
jgi:hypothetical protein